MFNRLLPIKILEYQLYIFQLEEYEVKRFINSLFKLGLLPRLSLRKSLVWTNKAKIIYLLASFIEIIFSLIISFFFSIQFEQHKYYLISLIISFLVTYFILSILSFIFIIQSSDLISPFENYSKKKLENKAIEKIKRLKDLKIIGITGSYGKTTMKELIYTIVSEKFKTVKTMGNNNTPIGISRTILNNLTDSTQIFVVEMGEYYKGDVAKLCLIAPPDISIITGINEAHLEKYGSMSNATSTKFEIIEYAKDNPYILLNYDDKLIKENYKNYIDEKNVTFYSDKGVGDLKITDYVFYEDGTGQKFEISNFGKIQTKILGEYIIGVIIAGIILGRKLGMRDEEIKLAISRLKPIEHRLDAKLNKDNILIIDDTYNANSNGIKEGLKTLSKFKSRRKVYYTPGLVETGSMEKEIHLELGRKIAENSDLVILIKNSVTPIIYQSLKENGFKEENIIWFENSKIALSNLFSKLKKDDVLLMQNDWTDNYK